MKPYIKKALTLLQTGSDLNVPTAICVLKIALQSEPVAWRYRHRNEWHYLGKDDPFPSDGWEPLYAEMNVTEDEAFEELEQRLKAQKVTEYVQRANTEAAKFIEQNQGDLGIMTLRKAFEIGFRYGFTAAISEKKNGSN